MERNIENTLKNHLEQLNRMLLKQMRKTKALQGGQKGNISSILQAGKGVLTGGTLFS